MSNTERTTRHVLPPVQIPVEWLAAMHNTEDALDRVDDLRYDLAGLISGHGLTEYERELIVQSLAQIKEAEAVLYKAAGLLRAALQNYAADGNLPGMAQRQ